MTITAKKYDPILVGTKDKTAVKRYTDTIRELWMANGVNTDWLSPVEFYRMREAPNQELAIPPKSSWGPSAKFIREVYQPIRQSVGFPILVLNGYRPPDYNRAVGGAPNSLHQSALALDLAPLDPTPERRRLLALTAAAHYLRNRDVQKLGFGVYGNDAHRIHLDGFGRSKPQAGWPGAEATASYLEQAGGVA